MAALLFLLCGELRANWLELAIMIFYLDLHLQNRFKLLFNQDLSQQ